MVLTTELFPSNRFIAASLIHSVHSFSRLPDWEGRILAAQHRNTTPFTSRAFCATGSSGFSRLQTPHRRLQRFDTLKGPRVMLVATKDVASAVALAKAEGGGGGGGAHLTLPSHLVLLLKYITIATEIHSPLSTPFIFSYAVNEGLGPLPIFSSKIDLL